MQYVFSDGKMNIERLTQLVEVVGKQRLILDLSCRKKVRNSSCIRTWKHVNSLNISANLQYFFFTVPHLLSFMGNLNEMFKLVCHPSSSKHSALPYPNETITVDS